MQGKSTYYVGIDGGGSKCSAMLFSQQGELLSQGIAGPANAARDLPLAIQSMVAAVQLALQNAGLSASLLNQLQVGAGLAGASVAKVHAELLAWPHPFATFKVSSDLATACCGAHGGEDGAILITGTGSSAALMRDGELTQFGGHGFLLGDKGSGAWLGRSAVAATLEALDGVISRTAMHDTVLEQLQCANSAALVQRMILASPSDFAALAPQILSLAEQDEPSATAIVRQGTEYLDKLCQRALQGSDLSLALIGGLAPLLQPWFSPQVRQRIVNAQAGPEWGAVQLLRASQVIAC